MPTAAPTAGPTEGFTDCSSVCILLNNDPVPIATENILQEIQISTNFWFQFNVQIPALASVGTVRNIVDVRDKVSSGQLLKVGITETNNIRVEYGGVVYVTQGLQLVADYANAITTLLISHTNGILSAWSSANPTSVDHQPLSTAPVDTSSRTYYVYASGPDGFVSSAGGLISTIYIHGTPSPFYLGFLAFICV
jgi:hypothetical protein